LGCNARCDAGFLRTENVVPPLPCFDCKNALRSEPEQLQNGDWIAHCDTCGVTNKLTRDDALPDKFLVSGMIINFKRD